MPWESARRLVALLEGDTLRHRTGILELPVAALGREAAVAALLGVGHADLRAHVLDRLAPDQRFLGLSWEGIINQGVDPLARASSPGSCILVANADLLVSYLRADERRRFWPFLREGYRPPRGVLLALPADNRSLLTLDERQLWVVADRLAGWEE